MFEKTLAQITLDDGIVKILGRVLGFLWLLDGLLQLQPKMFGATFVATVLSPNLTRQPAFFHALIAFGIHLFTLNTAVANCAAALLQVAIGVLLLCPAGSKKFSLGLWLSVTWGLAVWAFGEGLGGLLTGSASLYTGAPGAALLYALIAALLLVPEKISSRLSARVAAAVFLLGAALQLQPTFWNAMGTQMIFQMSASDTLRAVNALPNSLTNSLAAHPAAFNWLLIIAPLLLATALLLKPNKLSASVAIAFLFIVWWLGQDFGGLSTLWVGTATDFNAAPLVALLVLPILVSTPKPTTR